MPPSRAASVRILEADEHLDTPSYAALKHAARHCSPGDQVMTALTAAHCLPLMRRGNTPAPRIRRRIRSRLGTGGATNELGATVMPRRQFRDAAACRRSACRAERYIHRIISILPADLTINARFPRASSSG